MADLTVNTGATLVCIGFLAVTGDAYATRLSWQDGYSFSHGQL